MDEMKIMADDKLEAKLKALQLKKNAFITLIYISVVLFILFLVMDIIPMALICVVLLIVFMCMANNVRCKVKDLLSENVINVLLKNTLGDNVKYEPWEKITPGSMLFPFPYCKDKGSQYIKGVYNGMNIELGNITLINEEEHNGPEGAETSNVPQFNGQWLICDLGRKLPGDVYISEVSKNDRKSLKSNVTIDDEHFDQHFRVRADDPQAAYSILTPQMMEYISAMADKIGCPVYLSFMRSGKMHAAIKSERELFEFEKGKVDVEALRRQFLSELLGVLNIIDMLHLEDNFYKKGENV